MDKHNCHVHKIPKLCNKVAFNEKKFNMYNGILVGGREIGENPDWFHKTRKSFISLSELFVVAS